MFDLEPTYFESQIREIVVPLFELADHNLNEWKKHIDADFYRACDEAVTESDRTNATGDAVCRGMTVDEQRALIGAACLAFIETAVKDCLDGMASYFESSHPPRRKYIGRGWLQRRQDEYEDRFRIDFTKNPVGVGNMEELILARNAGLHWDGSALEEYRRKVTLPRFIKDEFFTVERDQFFVVISEAQAFIAWVHTELGKLLPNPTVAQE